MTGERERITPDAAHRSLDDGLLMSVLCDVIEYWPVAVLLVGRDGGCLPNVNALRLFGLVMNEGTIIAPQRLMTALGLRCGDSKRILMVDEYPSQRALQGEQVLDDFLIHDRRTGAEVTLRCSAQPIRSTGTIVGAMMTWTDISDLRRSTERIQRSACDLQQFLAIASHDLQQPIRTMRNYLGLLRQRVALTMDGIAAKLLDHAEQGAERMHRLLGSLLVLTRLDRQEDRREQVECAAVVRDVLDQLADEIAAAQAEIVVDDLPTVSANRAFLMVLLQNLVGNSLKYRHPDRRCRIVIGIRHLPHETALTVNDNGLGIEDEYLDEIFKPFQRLGVTPGVNGSGLGLDICRRIVSAHDGRIWVESTPGVGSTFLFTLGTSHDHTALEHKTAPRTEPSPERSS